MDATGDVILVQGGGSVAATRQTSRTMKRTANLQERLQEKSQAVGERADAVVAPLHGGAGGESELADKAGKSQMLEDASGNNVSLMWTMLRAMLHETSTQLMDEQKKMLERLWDALMGNQRMTTQMMGEQLEMVRQLQQEVQAVEESRKVDELRRLHEQFTRQLRVMREQMSEQIRTTREQTTEQLKIIREQIARNFEQMRLQVMKEVGIVQGQAAEEIRQAKEELKQAREEMQQAKEEISQMKEQLNTIAGSISSGAQTSPQPSYADVARTPPTSQPSNVRTLSSMRITPSSFTDTLFCAIDTSRVSEEDRGKAQVGEVRQAIEEKVRAREGGQPNWRCAAVVKDVRNEDRIKVVCRDEAELQLVREAAERTMVKGVRVLRDQLYPVKVDGANRTAVLDSSGNILPGAAEALGKENVVTIAKM
ncbi:reverse transcriptase, partial [Fusarium mundagurra]